MVKFSRDGAFIAKAGASAVARFSFGVVWMNKGADLVLFFADSGGCPLVTVRAVGGGDGGNHHGEKEGEERLDHRGERVGADKMVGTRTICVATREASCYNRLCF